MKKQIIDLDHVLISPVIYNRWMRMLPSHCEKIIRMYKEKDITFSPSKIPDEQFRADKDGNGEIFIEIPEIGFYASIDVGPKEWSFIGSN